MRTRTRNGPFCSAILLSEHKWNTNWTSPNLSDNLSSLAPSGILFTYPASQRLWSETITDDTGVGGGFRPCQHVVETNEFFNQRVRILAPGAGDSNYFCRTADAGSVAALKTFASPSTIDVEALKVKAIQTMTPRINEGQSMVNFVLELKDLKSWLRVGSAIKRIRGRLPSGTRAMNNGTPNWEVLPYSDLLYRLPGGKSEMFKNIIKRLTGAHLEASFGIVPFVADLVGSYTDLANLDYKVKQLKAHAGRLQQRHFRSYPLQGGIATNGDWRYMSTAPSSWNVFNTDSAGGNRDTAGGGGAIQVNRRARYILRPVYHATMRYIYTLPWLGEVEEKIRTKMDALGVRLDPGIIWDALPFSFIVDWVADVSSFLHSFAKNNFPIEIHVGDFCHSLAYHYEAEIIVSFATNSTTNYAPAPTWWLDTRDRVRVPGVIYRKTYSSYDRTVSTTGNPSVAIKEPGAKQAALSGSLIVNKFLGGTLHNRRSGGR